MKADARGAFAIATIKVNHGKIQFKPRFLGEHAAMLLPGQGEENGVGKDLFGSIFSLPSALSRSDEHDLQAVVVMGGQGMTFAAAP